MNRGTKMSRQSTIIRLVSAAMAVAAASSFSLAATTMAPQQSDEKTRDGRRKENPAADQALRNAAFEGKLEEVIAAHADGGRIDVPDQNGGTALMLASFNGHTKTAAWLIDQGADVNARDGVWRTALMYSSSGPFEETVKLLLDHGADPNVTDRFESWTALMFAAGEGNTAVVKLLLQNGADAQTVDDDGDAAIDHALANRHEEIVQLLREHLGTPREDSK